MGKLDEAERAYQAGIAIYEQLTRDEPGTPRHRDMLGLTLNNLAGLYGGRREFERTVALGRRAVSIYEPLAKEYPQAIDYSESLVMSQTTLAGALSHLGSEEEARGRLVAAIATARQLVASHPDVPLLRQRLVEAYRFLARVEARLGRPEASRTILEQADRLTAELLAAHPDSAEYREEVWTDAVARADVLLELGRPTEAVAVVAAVSDRPVSYPSTVQEAAGVLARASRMFSPPAEADRIAGRAVELLHRAAALGQRDPAQYTGDADLAPLRGRDDFRLLMMDLAMPAEVFARQAATP
jgi:tetratricopeptide (TPR) repeat protein